MFSPDSRYSWQLSALGIAAIAGATITAGTTGTVPHDLVGIAVAVVGFLAGQRVGKAVEQLRQANGHSVKPPV